MEATIGLVDWTLGLHNRKTKELSSIQGMITSKSYVGDSVCSQRLPRQILVHLMAYFGLTVGTMALLESGHNPDLKDTYTRTPLSYAAENGHDAVVKMLLAKGVDPNSKDKYGQTPLSYAAEWGRTAVVKLLLENNRVDPDSKDKYGQTPLSWALLNGRVAVVKLLRRYSATG
jgi:ankyrin repeat protein